MMRKSAKEVISEVAAMRKVSAADLTGGSRHRAITVMRHEAMFEVYTQCPHLSFPAIALAFGGMDHSSIIYAVQKHCRRIGVDYAEVRRMTKYIRDAPVEFTRTIFTPASAKDYRTASRIDTTTQHA